MTRMSRHALPDVIRAIRDAFEVVAGENGHRMIVRNKLTVEAGYETGTNKYRFTIGYLGFMRVSSAIDLNEDLPLDQIISRDAGIAIGTVAQQTAPNIVIDEFNKLPVSKNPLEHLTPPEELAPKILKFQREDTGDPLISQMQKELWEIITHDKYGELNCATVAGLLEFTKFNYINRCD